MRFFIPAVTDETKAEEVYPAIQKHLADGVGADWSANRFQELRYRHEGKERTARVGDLHYGETVVAILYDRSRDLYHVCTPNRGVIRGGSILVGGHEVVHVI